MTDEDSKMIAAALRSAMKQALTVMDLDAWASEAKQQRAIASLTEADRDTYREAYRAYRRTLPLSTVEAG